MERDIVLLCVVIGIGYIILIGPVSSIFLSSNSENNIIKQVIVDSGGSNVQLGVSDGISVSVVRNRWYGKINEENGIESLKLFNLVKVPLKVGSFNFIWIHAIVFIVLVGWPVKTLIIDKRRLKK